MNGGQAQTSSSIGRHSELLAQVALTANGWTVLIPDGVEPFDLAITRKGDATIKRIQIKTIVKRFKEGVWWYVIRAKKNSGEVYDEDDCSLFIGVYDGCVYMTPNRFIGEYWVRVDEAGTKWTRLMTTIELADRGSKEVEV